MKLATGFAIASALLAPLEIMASASATPKSPLPAAVFFPGEDGSFVGTNFGRWARYGPHQIRFDSGLAVTFRGAGRRPKIQGIEQAEAAVHVMKGSSRVSQRAYSAIRYTGLYPGVDMECRFAANGWKSDFLLAPGAKVSSIRMEYQGIGKVSIGPWGQLRITTANGEMEERIPAVYQTLAGGGKAYRAGTFQLESDGSVGFRVADLDPALPTVIDPSLQYSSYWAGNRNEAITSVAFGSDDSIYIAGWTESTSLPVLGAVQSAHKGSTDCFVAKLSPNGQTLQWATFFGGTGADRVNAMAIDSSRRAIIAGSTSSSNFPVQSALQSSLRGSIDGFVARFAAGGAALDFSTYYGGSGSDAVNAVAVDSTGIYLAGQTTSTDFPVLGAISGAALGGQDGFLAKLSVSGSTITYSTYLGGANDDTVTAMAVYQQQPFVAGGTSSANLPVVAGLGPRGGMDAFVMKIAASGASILNSTYLGGTNGSSASPEMATAIQVTPNGEAIVGGMTGSADFPVLNAAQPIYGRGGSDGFVVKYTSSLGAVLWSTYLGGSSYDTVYALALRPSGQVVATGMTGSANFPVVQPVQATFGGFYDAFVTVFQAYGSITYSSVWGGNGSDAGLSVGNGIVDANSILFGGSTSSTNLTMAGGGYQTSTDPASLNAFFAKMQVSGGILHKKDKVGYYRNGGFALDKTGDYLWNTGDVAFPFGINSDTPVVGDWTGSGVYRVGVFRGGVWYVDINGDNSWTWGVDAYYYYGIPGDIPLVGDWTGDGRSKVGVYRPSTNIFYLDYDGNNAWTNYLDKIIPWGGSGDIPVVGDWNGNGISKIGLFNAGIWRLDWNGDYQFTGADVTYPLGAAGDIPIPMNLTTAFTQPIVFRPSTGEWISLNGTFAHFGYPGDIPVVGPW